MDQVRRVAIIGAGIGGEHLTGYLALPERFKVHTICDLDRERADELLIRAVGANYTDTLDAVLADRDVDIVDICLPPHLHFESCERALRAGKHVICEKPLVSSLREADELIALSSETGRSVFPVFQYRFGLAGMQIQKLIDCGLAGKPYAGTLETHWNRGKDYYAVPWRGTWTGEQGGAVLGHAIHIHDWLSFVFGPVNSVYADLATRVNEIETEDCAALAIRMQSGALVTSSITLGAATDTSRLRFCFQGLTAESGTAPYTPAEDLWTFTAREPVLQSAIDAALKEVARPPAGYVGLFDAVAESLDGRPGREVTLDDGRRSLEFVSAVYASSRQGGSVGLPLGASDDCYDGWLPESVLA